MFSTFWFIKNTYLSNNYYMEPCGCKLKLSNDGKLLEGNWRGKIINNKN